jgi:hypothetical protein
MATESFRFVSRRTAIVTTESFVYIFGNVTPRWPWYLPPRSL